MGHYSPAQICEDGHIINSNMEEFPEKNQKYCDQCSQPTINSCPHCKTYIRGDYIEIGLVDFSEDKAPSFCHECGKPYPWIENSINAMIELMEYEGTFTDDDKEDMKKAIVDISNDSSRTELGVLKIKKAYKHISPEMKKIFTNIISTIVAEKAKQELGLK